MFVSERCKDIYLVPVYRILPRLNHNFTGSKIFFCIELNYSAIIRSGNAKDKWISRRGKKTIYILCRALIINLNDPCGDYVTIFLGDVLWSKRWRGQEGLPFKSTPAMGE